MSTPTEPARSQDTTIRASQHIPLVSRSPAMRFSTSYDELLRITAGEAAEIGA
jgi:hypothetical protein